MDKPIKVHCISVTQIPYKERLLECEDDHFITVTVTGMDGEEKDFICETVQGMLQCVLAFDCDEVIFELDGVLPLRKETNETK